MSYIKKAMKDLANRLGNDFDLKVIPYKEAHHTDYYLSGTLKSDPRKRIEISLCICDKEYLHCERSMNGKIYYSVWHSLFDEDDRKWFKSMRKLNLPVIHISAFLIEDRWREWVLDNTGAFYAGYKALKRKSIHEWIEDRIEKWEIMYERDPEEVISVPVESNEDVDEIPF